MPDSSQNGGMGFNKIISPIIEETPLGSEAPDAISRALRNAIATQPETSAVRSAPGSLIMQEVRYQMADAGEVLLLWGINGWQKVPEAARLPGTAMKNNGAMRTVMTRDGDTFVAKVQVPAGSVVDFNFWINKARDGTEVQVWDTNGYPPRNYQTIARPDHAVVVLPTFDLEKARAEAKRTYAPLVTQEIRYQVDGATEVSLLWGINGWQSLPEVNRPSGTVIKNGRMHTPMSQERGAYVAKVQVPSGTVIDYRLLLTKTNDGPEGNTLESVGDFRRTVTTDGIIDVNAKVGSAKQDAVQSESSENVSDNSVVTQGFRHYWIRGGAVVLAALLALAVLALLKAARFSTKKP